MFRRLLAGLCALVALAPAASALTLVGNAAVIDSDVLLIDGYRIFLFGVESVEAQQTCSIRGQRWDCYPAAVRALQTIVVEGTATCNVVGGPDVLNQVFAVCMVNGTDVAERLVRAGFGVVVPAETEIYRPAETAAREARVGFWQGEFAPPSIWRLANRLFAAGRPVFRPTTAP